MRTNPEPCAPQSALDDAPEGAAAPAASEDVDHAQRMTELFNRYQSKLVKSLVTKTRSYEEARDIASQAFLEVLSQRPGTVDFLGAYLYRTAHNLATNRLAHLAMRERKKTFAGSLSADESLSAEELLIRQQEEQFLLRAIEELSPRHRMALVLRVWEELSYGQIVQRFASKGIDVNVRTVQRYVACAIEHCRRESRQAKPGEGGR